MGYDGPGHGKALAERVPSRRRDVIVKQTSEALDKVWRAAGLAAQPATAAAWRLHESG